MTFTVPMNKKRKKEKERYEEDQPWCITLDTGTTTSSAAFIPWSNLQTLQITKRADTVTKTYTIMNNSLNPFPTKECVQGFQSFPKRAVQMD